jgi:hypothetical protein
MSWGVFPEGRTGLPSLLDPLLKSSSLDPPESSLLDPLLELLSSFDPLWNLLYSTLYCSLLHWTISGDFFNWPSLESYLLVPLLESSSLDPLLRLLHLTLYWSLFHLTLSGVFFSWFSLESPLLDPQLESSSLDPLLRLLHLTLYWSLFHLTLYWRPLGSVWLLSESGLSCLSRLFHLSLCVLCIILSNIQSDRTEQKTLMSRYVLMKECEYITIPNYPHDKGEEMKV